MKSAAFTPLALACCLLNPSARAQSIEGAWQTAQTGNDGNTTHTVYRFHQEGEALRGQVEVAWGNLPLEVGVIHDGHFTFQIHMGESVWKYEGIVNADGITLTVHDPNSSPATTRATHLTAQSDQGAVRAIPPPALHIVSPNGLALTPPMGWNSWNYFQGRIDDKLVREVADTLVKNGMHDAGYIYINIDDTWEGPRAADGSLRPNRKFPDMKALADYVHSRGLKLGIYSSPGPETCASYPGSYGHEEQDAATFAAWGIDYLKYDWCSAFRLYPDKDMRAVYQRMGDALEKTGRPIIFSISAGGKDNVWTWGRLAGANLWRTTDDINASWKRIETIGFSQSPLSSFANPGGWNDPDMLEVGNGTLTLAEQQTHMAQWSLLAAPLITGNDVRSMSAETAAILTNREVIAVDQDPMGKQAERVYSKDGIEAWSRPLDDGSIALGIFNRADHTQTADIQWKDLRLARPIRMRDLWRHADIATPGNSLKNEIPPHGCVLLRLSR